VSQEHVHDSIPAYVLGCLDQAELKSVQQHIWECPLCQEETRQYQKVVDQLAFATRDSVPAENLKNKILSQVKESTIPARSKGRRSSWYQRVFKIPQPVLLVSSLVLLIALVVTNIFYFNESQWNKQQNTAGEFQYVSLAGTQTTPNASGLLIISANQRTATLIVDGLPQLSERQDYQLWLIQDGKRTSGGVFNVIQTGFGALLVNSQKPLTEFQSFGITIEPKGGSAGPTGDKVLGGNF
jgi:anti-sigma-K factor RskA